MAQQTIGIGAAPDDGNGDPLRTAMDKSNDNFTELYARLEGMITGNVANFSALPAAASNTGKYYLVDASEGSWILFTLKKAGVYKSDGATWNYLGAAIADQRTDSNMVIGDNGDTTKTLKFELSGGTTGTGTTLTTSQTTDKSVDLGDQAGTVVVKDGSDNVDSINEITISNAANDDLDIFNTIGNKISTGFQNGSGILSINADNTKFDISDGVGYIVDNYTDEAAPVPTRVAFSGKTAIASTYVATDNVSYVAINSAGTVLQQTTEFTTAERRTLLVCGTLVHPGSTITATSDFSKGFESSHLADDMAAAIGNMNISGNNYNAAGTNLTVRKEAGVTFSPNVNRGTDPDDPHFKTDVVENPVTFLYVYNDGSSGITAITGQTNLDPDQYDDGTGTLATVSNNKWTNHVCYFFPASDTFIIRYGTEEFGSLADAKEAALELPATIGTGLDPEFIRTVISIKKGETDNSSADTFYTDTGKLGIGSGGGGGSGGGSFQDLQDTYDNSVTPEITTDSTRGALTVQGGTGTDTDNNLEGKNNAGTTTFLVNGTGCIENTQQLTSHTASSADDHALEIITDAAGFGDVKAVDVVYDTGAIGAGEIEGVVLLNIDESDSTDGMVHGLEVLATAEGGADVNALKVGAQVNPLSHDAGTFGDLDTFLVLAVDNTTAVNSGGAGNVGFFASDNDTITIGDAAMFEEIEFILDTEASHNANVTFEFSTGVGTWTTFAPTDGTNGFQNTGLILWDDADIPSWAVGTGSEYLIRITRTRNSLPTTPIVDLVQISAVTVYGWDKDAALTIKEIDAADGITLTERADHLNAPAAGSGQLWVKNDTPCKPYFTDDAGTDFDLSEAGTINETLVISIGDETTDMTTGTAKTTFRMPYAMTLSEVRASVTTAPTGSVATFDINETASTILSTKITIDATEKTSETAATAPVISDSSLADDAEITIDIDTIGSTVAGAGPKIYLIGTRT